MQNSYFNENLLDFYTILCCCYQLLYSLCLKIDVGNLFKFECIYILNVSRYI
jgi:hypothetical protein